ncbi:unnamed protein product [Rotaria sordida]|uniref:Acetyl-CoA carboxylase n=2 Tax=Rotaria sordida TaxID=392033 RepID=A0A818U9F5_9BILA|nr:unnamed protein product [Rotaria sordida]
MSTNCEEKNLDSKVADQQNLQSSHVKFDLDESHRIDDYDRMVEVDELVAFSTPSKPSSYSSIESTTNKTTNSSMTNARTLTNSDTNGKNKSTLNQHSRNMSGVSFGSSGSLRPLTTVSTPKGLCDFLGGNRVINKILIANNGIAAVKCMRSIRRWSYEMFRQENTIKFVAMVTPEDMQANAEYIRYADHYVNVQGGPSHMNYSNCELIVDIAKRFPVEAVWAGWGHASENPKLPELLHRNDIIFIGPSEQAMWALGDKIASTIIAQSANVPTLPWSGSHLKITYNEDDSEVINVPMDLYDQACVTDPKKGLEIATRIGFPVMIKASEGGGGKGIRKSISRDDFENLFRQVQTEVRGSPIFIMKYADSCRHLEVQILADQSGQAISLFGRDCSIQRRHQKIIEEAPAVIAPPEILEQMEKAAVRLAKMVGYASAGTVEYLYNPNDETFCFLELNPRLQVEHPCTEMITDVNLPACQLQIAMGISLHRIKYIRLLYGEEPFGTSSIDFDKPKNKPILHGHAIAARITSEDPDEGFKPSSGTVEELNFRSRQNVWGYFSISSCGGLHEFADSQFGHIFSHGDTRDDARENLVVALKELSIRGDFHSTVEILIRLLETEAFINNTVKTSWLDTLIAEHFQTEKPNIMISIVCGAIHVADEQFRTNFQNFQASLERGQILPMHTLSISTYVELTYERIKYRLQITKCGPSCFFVVMNDSYVEVEANRMKGGGILINLDGSSYLTFMKEDVDSYRIIINNKSCVFQKENDPSVLRSPSAGKLLHYTVEDGGPIDAGQVYAEIEVMKMVTELRCPSKGHLQWNKRPGAILEASCVLAHIIFDDSHQILQSTLYDGKFRFEITNHSTSTKFNQIFQTTKQTLENILYGYTYPEPYFRERLKLTVEKLFSILRDPSLPLLEVEDILSNISERIPQEVKKEIKKLLKNYQSNLTSVLAQFPSQSIATFIDNYATKLEHRTDRDVFFTTVQSLVLLVKRYRNGIKGHMKAIITDLIKNYLNIETLFQFGQYDKCLTQLRDKHKIDMHKVVEIVFSHANYNSKNALVIMLIDLLLERDPRLTDELTALLSEITSLTNPHNAKVALKARQVLIEFQQPPYELRNNQMESIFLSALDMYGHKFCQENLQKLILSETSIFDVLHSFYFHPNVQVRQSALEVYVRRSYISYDLTSIQHGFLSDGTCTVQFSLYLPLNHPNRLYVQENSVRNGSFSDDMMLMFDDEDPELFRRTGIIAAFDSLERAKYYFDELLIPFTSSSSSSSSSFNTRCTTTSRKIIYTYHRQASHDSSPAQKPTSQVDQATNLIYVFINDDANLQQNYKFEDVFLDFVQSKNQVCAAKNIRRITFSLAAKRKFPSYFTYRKRLDFEEDKIFRHLEPALAYQLELYRLRSFEIEYVPTSNHKVHIYLGKGKVRNKQNDTADYRLFARSIIRHSDLVTKETSYEYLQNEAERTLIEAMDELEIAFSHPLANKTDCNHVFMCFVPTVCIEPSKLEESVREMVLRYGLRLWKLRILQAELKMTLRLTPDAEPMPFRAFMTYESGYHLDISLYREVTNQATGQTVFQTYNIGKPGPFEGRALHEPYLTKDQLQYKRFTAQSNSTTYVYDLPEMFRRALVVSWKQYFDLNKLKDQTIPKDNFICQELILDNTNQVKLNDSSSPVSPASIPSSNPTSTVDINEIENKLQRCGLITRTRLPAENDCGVVAWRIRMRTPECPNGRTIIVIANDITYKIGSFGIDEDLLFQRVSELSRLERIPRIYISANSGARIGLAEELKFLYHIAWNDPKDVEKGIRYLYLTPEDNSRVSSMNCVRTEGINDDGEIRYKIIDIIGKENSLGVENLRGSGMIAGETSLAYNVIPTISLVTCRAVGIGAYLVRLGSRVIQVENSHIILTGAGALNKVLGREVYNSNNQLGGTQIMFNNGITHDVVKDDFDGCILILRWLSYMPETMLHLPPILPGLYDPIERTIDFIPTSTPYDPRHMIQGRQLASTQQSISYSDTGISMAASFQSGFFDRDSFVEIMKGWAKTVVCGRARLGGIPMGVIAVETRTVELEQPADPANFDTDARTIQQAGQVWFPDSAFKTAQAINDFKRENLPLMIFANWRGFSGGMKDMFDQIMKFGAYIVDALREYEQPVFCYIPPFGELRGGAWVVIDPTINLRYMEMYADRLSRGGVLEPEGTVEIKYRTKDLSRTIHRLDPVCREIIAEMTSSTTGVQTNVKEELERQLIEREKILSPVYLQAAVMFCDLHDTPGRMLEKGVIREILDWRTSREFFYWRLKRRLGENNAIKTILTRESSIDYQSASNYVQQWFNEDKNNDTSQWTKDKIVAEWLEQFQTSSSINDRIQVLQKQNARQDIHRLLQTYPDLLSDILANTTDQQRSELNQILNSDKTKM